MSPALASRFAVVLLNVAMSGERIAKVAIVCASFSPADFNSGV